MTVKFVHTTGAFMFTIITVVLAGHESKSVHFMIICLKRYLIQFDQDSYQNCLFKRL